VSIQHSALRRRGKIAVKALRDKGGVFNIRPAFRQEELGILSIADATMQAARFNEDIVGSDLTEPV
jgi:hypothetical protein